ncbi:MAG: hypothetical protein IJ188_03810 [Clostridia bacterium]|nr:hypothetical protein [Clostridia bacterium]
MYVIQEEKGYYYVCVPAGEIVWPMQVEGTYGYVSKKDVDLAWTPAELDWLEE